MLPNVFQKFWIFFEILPKTNNIVGFWYPDPARCWGSTTSEVTERHECFSGSNLNWRYFSTVCFTYPVNAFLSYLGLMHMNCCHFLLFFFLTEMHRPFREIYNTISINRKVYKWSMETFYRPVYCNQSVSLTGPMSFQWENYVEICQTYFPKYVWHSIK